MRQRGDGSVDGEARTDEQEAAEEYFGPKFLARVHARMHSHPVTSVLTKIVVTIVGVVVMLAGVVMMVTPGPGIVALILGLAILSTEWHWADRWLDAARAYAKKTADAAREMDPAVRRQRVLWGIFSCVFVVVLVGGAIAAWGWPEAAEDVWHWAQGHVELLPDLPGMND